MALFAREAVSSSVFKDQARLKGMDIIWSLMNDYKTFESIANDDAGRPSLLPAFAPSETIQLSKQPSFQSSPSDLFGEPPSDIQGRCGPSNLPGSLSACLAAC